MGIRVFEQHEAFTIKEAFTHGHFTVKKTSHVFSVMGISQSHEQNKNRPVKVDGRAFGIMDNESALLEWGLSGPYEAEIVCESANACPSNHHEDTKSFKKEFPLR